MSTGFYRTVIHKKNNKTYYKYVIKNKLIFKEITRKDIMDLKNEVEKQGFLWGITDLEDAEKNSGQYKLEALQGKYGEQVGE